jgi:hypothetical protein
VGRSLKTQQHAATLTRTTRVRRRGLPGSVDMLGPVRSELGVKQAHGLDVRGSRSTRPSPASGTLRKEGSLERR